MASTRSYDFITGPQTSTAPTAGTPTTDNDILSKGYADDTYAKLQYWGDAVADTNALKAVSSADRSDQQIRLKDDNQTLWKFDSGSSATEDGTTVIQPTSGTGRWLIASGTGGGSGGSASAIEALESQNELVSQGYYSKPMDNAVRANGLEVPIHTYFTGYLIEDYTSGGSSIKTVWNPIQFNSSDKNMDATTNFTATGAGATLTTSATCKIGSTSIQIDKNGTAVEAGIRYDQGSQILNVAANYRVWVWLNLPSITNLTNAGIRMYADTTSNYRTFTTTTDYSGAALAVGWNLLSFDISTGGTASGSGWTYTSLSRYQELFVTTSSAGQTYTALLWDALNFSHGDVASWAPKYLEFTVADTSNKHDMIIDSTNTRSDGPLTLGATVAQSYTAGISNSNAAKLYRSPMSWSQSGLIGFNSSLTSGTISTTEEFRITRLLRESLSGNYGAYVDMYTPQIYKVTAVGGSTIDVADPENHSANLLNGDSVHIFTTTYSAGEPNFTLLATRAMTANSSASSGTTTLTLTTSGIAVGDYVVKQHLSTSLSVVSASANESFSAMSYDTSPNGAQLIGSRAYPYPSFVYAHSWLGATSESIALRDQSGNNRGLSKLGSPNLADTFKAGKFSYSTSATTDYVRLPAGSAAALNATASLSLVQFSLWFYYNGTNVSDRELFNAWSFHGGADYRGWKVYITGSDNKLTFNLHNNAASPSSTLNSAILTSGTWNHLFCQVKGTSVHTMYLNGVLNSTTAGAIAGSIPTAQASYVGVRSDSTSADASLAACGTGLKYADLIVWLGAPQMGQAEVNYLYNSANPQFFGYNPAILRNEYTATGQSGQRLSLKGKLTRSTTAVSPYILNAGVIKTG